jgi:hypothetical protein
LGRNVRRRSHAATERQVPELHDARGPHARCGRPGHPGSERGDLAGDTGWGLEPLQRRRLRLLHDQERPGLRSRRIALRGPHRGDLDRNLRWRPFSFQGRAFHDADAERAWAQCRDDNARRPPGQPLDRLQRRRARSVQGRQVTSYTTAQGLAQHGAELFEDHAGVLWIGTVGGGSAP